MARLRGAGAAGLAVAVTAALTGLGVVSAARPAAALDNGLALTPPMGWNGYNHFSHDVTASTVEAEARALVSSGMKADGYQYVNLDGGWDLLRRNAAGDLQPDPAEFPQGIKPVADYVHSLGLKFGIYTSAGTANCAQTSAGSYGHYAQDARTFASWGVDYVKFDRCEVPYSNYPDLTHAQVTQMLAAKMHQAIKAAGRPMVFDVNDARQSEHDWTWAPPIANLWRVTGDINDSYRSMVNHFTEDVAHAPDVAAGGGWSDPDMLEVGNGGMTVTEERSEFSLWAELAAPLIAGNDLTTMSAATRAILTNRAVIAVDQDPLGRQGRPIASSGGHWVLTKPLAGGGRAVVLFNQTGTPAEISTTAARAGLPAAAAYTLADLWSHNTTETAGTIAAEVPAHGVVMYRVAPTGQPAAYPPQTRLTLSAPSPWLAAGRPATVTATLTNDGRLPAREARVGLQVPHGWSAPAPVTLPAVAGGQSAAVRWQVTAGAVSGCSATLNARAAYLWGDQPGTATPTASTAAATTVGFPCPLAAAFNNTGISDDSNVDAGNFDGVGDSYSAQLLAAGGFVPGKQVQVNGMTFTWPDASAGQPGNVVAEGQTIKVSGSGTRLGFLGAGSPEDEAGSGTVYYTDGSTSTFNLVLDNWWSAPGAENHTALSMRYVNSAGIGGRPHGQRNHTVYLFSASVALTPGKTVAAVTLPSGGTSSGDRIRGMHIFAIGIG